MNTTTVNTEGIDRLVGKIRSLESIDFMPLMVEWGVILTEDNREGALAGLDGFGIPLIPVTYRPDPKAGSRKTINFDIQANNNLTSGHYRTLDGPPLAPRREESRIVTNFVTSPEGPMPDGSWHALGAWTDIVDINGDFEILTAHFPGPDHNPRLPVRDLAHVRPSALEKARTALRSFVQVILGRQF